MLREARRQVKKESRILGRTRTSLIKEVTNGAREMRLMGARMTHMLEPIQDVHRSMCVSEGRFTQIPWSRSSSQHRENVVRIKDRYAERSAAFSGKQRADVQAPRSLMRPSSQRYSRRARRLCFSSSGRTRTALVWRLAQFPTKRGARLIMMPVRMRTCRPSKVWPLEEQEQEQGFEAGVGQAKPWR